MARKLLGQVESYVQRAASRRGVRSNGHKRHESIIYVRKEAIVEFPTGGLMLDLDDVVEKGGEENKNW
jgi:hypothetical protein